jgi:predicted GH43/DUF377 family glycosyl hydrolase
VELDPGNPAVSKGGVRTLDFKLLPPAFGEYHEDPRFFVHQGNLCLSFVVGAARGIVTRQVICRLDEAMTPRDHVFVNPPEAGVSQQRNWVFFEARGALYSTYSMGHGSHEVLRIAADGSIAERFRSSYQDSWPVGEVRGGSNLVPVDGRRVGFFHSHVIGRDSRNYAFGAYEMEAEPPFRILKMSAEPIYTATEHEKMPDATWRAVVFPCGAILRDGVFTVAFGFNDRECRLLTVQAGELERSMIDVGAAPEPRGFKNAA